MEKKVRFFCTKVFGIPWGVSFTPFHFHFHLHFNLVNSFLDLFAGRVTFQMITQVSERYQFSFYFTVTQNSLI